MNFCWKTALSVYVNLFYQQNIDVVGSGRVSMFTSLVHGADHKRHLLLPAYVVTAEFFWCRDVILVVYCCK